MQKLEYKNSKCQQKQKGLLTNIKQRKARLKKVLGFRRKKWLVQRTRF